MLNKSEIVEKMEKYLKGNLEEAINIVSQINGWDESLEELYVYSMSEFDYVIECSDLSPTELIDKVQYGDFITNNDYFTFDGLGNLISACFGGLGSCSYGESVATIGFSRVASVCVTATAAVLLGLLGFVAPVQAFIASIPSCVFAGAAIILYGFIACSGVKMLQKVDLNVQKNLIIVSAVLSLGISGLVVGGQIISFSATALALIVGVILNLILRDKE